MGPKRQKLMKDRHLVDICGVKVDDISFQDAVDKVILMALSQNRGQMVVTINSEFIMMARRNAKFARILKNATLAVPDGAFVVFSKLIAGGKERDRVTGTDLLSEVCRKSANMSIRIGFLGGFGDVAEEVAKRQIHLNPQLQVTFAEPGDPTMGYDLRLKSKILAAGGVDILFVAYGMGQQEYWIEENRRKLPVSVFIGVGGAFDYLSGEKARAPKFLQAVGGEWLWRLVQEPARIWRMRVLPVFFLLVFFYFLKKLKKSWHFL